MPEHDTDLYELFTTCFKLIEHGKTCSVADLCPVLPHITSVSRNSVFGCDWSVDDGCVAQGKLFTGSQAGIIRVRECNIEGFSVSVSVSFQFRFIFVSVSVSFQFQFPFRFSFSFSIE